MPDFAAPLGGFKESGIGREGGREGFDQFVELQAILGPAALAERGADVTPSDVANGALKPSLRRRRPLRPATRRLLQHQRSLR
jgi:hypothetical protein